jgi:excisionase family DNA binding protein
MANEPMTLVEAAERLGVHYMTVYRYVRTGRLPATRDGGTWRVDPADLALVRPGATRGPPAGGRTGRRRAGTPSALVDRLVAGDEAGAWTLMESALASGRTPPEVLLELIGAALRDIGMRWEQGQLSVADEHRASQVASRLISRIGARFARRGRQRGAVIVCTPPGERHAAPVAMAADLLRWSGFAVVELGADTPADALGEAAERTPGLLAIGMACTTPSSCASARRTITALRRTVPEVPVLVGGAAVTDAEHAVRLGADFFTGHRGDELVAVVTSIEANPGRL